MRKGEAMDDKNIIKLLNDRKEKAIKELEIKYGGICMSIAKNVLGNISDAEECVNDALLAVWNSIPPNQPDILGAYVCKVAKNLSLKKLDYNMALKRNSHYDVSLEELSECISSNSVDTLVNEKELAEHINRFLGMLNKDNRVMFVRRYWYCDSISVIAKMFNMRENTVSVKLSRTREKLREYLLKEGINV